VPVNKNEGAVEAGMLNGVNQPACEHSVEWTCSVDHGHQQLTNEITAKFCFCSLLGSTWSSPDVPLEGKLRRQLDYPRPAATQAGIGLSLVRSLGNYVIAAWSDGEAGQRKVGVVEDVEEFRSQLQIQSLGDGSILRDREIQVPEMRAINGISAEVSESPIWRLRKRIAIQVSHDVGRRLPIGINVGLARHEVRTLVTVAGRWEAGPAGVT